jgi:hypothetical protein
VDATSRSGPLSLHVLSTSEQLERVLVAWSGERFRAEDALMVSEAFRVLKTELFSPEADILLDEIIAEGTGPARTYRFKVEPDTIPPQQAMVLGMSLRAACRWGAAMNTVMDCVALAAQDIFKTSTAFLGQRIRISAQVAAWRDVRMRQPASVGPTSALIDPARLADPSDHVVLGLHAATVRPDRLRPLFQAIDKSVVQAYSKENAKTLISPAEWEAAYGGAGSSATRNPVEAPAKRGSRRGRARARAVYQRSGGGWAPPTRTPSLAHHRAPDADRSGPRPTFSTNPSPATQPPGTR